MTRRVWPRVVALLLLLGSLQPAIAQAPKSSGYDPAANPAAALSRALEDAKATSRQVLVIAGGDWCSWCHILDAYLARNPDVDAAFRRAFVTIKVFYGDENRNEAFFSKLPRAKGYPHFWVIDSDGRLHKSVNTGPLENDKGSYDKARMLDFVRDLQR